MGVVVVVIVVIVSYGSGCCSVLSDGIGVYCLLPVLRTMSFLHILVIVAGIGDAIKAYTQRDSPGAAPYWF